MTITADTHIVLAWNTAKKDATVGTGRPGTLGDIDDDSVAFWANGITNPEWTTETVATFRRLGDKIQDVAKKGGIVGDAIASMPINGSDNEIAFTEPAAGEVGIYVGANIALGGKTHFHDRTCKRLRERWLELAKNGA